MALSKLGDDVQRHIFSQLCNVLDPGVAVAFGIANSELRALTQADRQQLKADYEVAAAQAAALGIALKWPQRKLSCKELREAKDVYSFSRLTEAELSLLGTLGAVLPALWCLNFGNLFSAGPDGVPRLAEKLGAGALPAVIYLNLSFMYVGDAGASALAAALDRGALPRLKHLNLNNNAIGDAGLVALAPALRRRPALEALDLDCNPLGDEGFAALVAPPPPARAPPPTTRGLAKLKVLDLQRTQITDAGCATLAAALDSGALPALEELYLDSIPASAAAKAAVYEGRTSLAPAVYEDD